VSEALLKLTSPLTLTTFSPLFPFTVVLEVMLLYEKYVQPLLPEQLELSAVAALLALSASLRAVDMLCEITCPPTVPGPLYDPDGST
jgi:hypothetical protein